MNTIVKPIRTTILHIRSKDAIQLQNDLNSNFSVNLVSAIESTEDQEIHCQLISAEIPNSAYNISAAVKNNTIVYDDTQTLTLPDQNYDVQELLRIIRNDVSFPFSISYNTYTNKITFTNNDVVSHTINWTKSLGNKLLGFGLASDEIITSTSKTTSPGMLDLATIHSIFIKSDLASGNVLSTRAGNSTTLQKISIDINAFGIVYLNQQDYRTVSVLQKPNISNINFRLTDQNDNLLDFNDINYEFSIQFMIFPRQQQRQNVRRTLEQPQNDLRFIQQPNPSPMIENNDFVEVDINENEDNADATHPVEGKTEIEKVAERTILDHIIDNL